MSVGDRTKCSRTECPRLLLTMIRVKVRVDVMFTVRAGVRHYDHVKVLLRVWFIIVIY